MKSKLINLYEKVCHIVFLILMIIPLSYNAGCKNGNTNAENENGQEIVGVWDLANPPGNMSVDMTFKSNGEMSMHGVMDRYTPGSEEKTIRGSWSQKGDEVYITSPGESEVGVMEILSIDNNSLVIHFQGEPDNEILYYNRR